MIEASIPKRGNSLRFQPLINRNFFFDSRQAQSIHPTGGSAATISRAGREHCVRQGEPAPQVGPVAGQQTQLEARFIGPEAMTRKPSPALRLLAFLDPLLGRPPLVKERLSRRYPHED
jgi:hypothetical protein